MSAALEERKKGKKKEKKQVFDPARD